MVLIMLLLLSTLNHVNYCFSICRFAHLKQRLQSQPFTYYYKYLPTFMFCRDLLSFGICTPKKHWKKLYFESLLKHNHTILVIFTLEATNLKSTPTTDYIQHLESWAPPKNKFIYWYCCHLSVLYSSIELHWVRTDFLQPWTVCLGTMHFIFMSLHAVLMFAKQHVKSDLEFSTSMHA